MSLPRTAADVLNEHVTLQVACIDRVHRDHQVPVQLSIATHSSVKWFGHLSTDPNGSSCMSSDKHQPKAVVAASAPRSVPISTWRWLFRAR